MNAESPAPTRSPALDGAFHSGLWAATLILLVVGLAFSGCSSSGGNASGFLIRKTPTVVQAAQTNFVPVTVTNYVGVTRFLTNFVTIAESATNANTGVVTPAIIQPLVSSTNVVEAVVETKLQPIILPAKTYDSLSLAPTVTGAVQMAGDLAPVPWAGGVASLLTALGGGVLAFINHRRAKAALDEKSSWQDTASVVIQNFEHLRDAAKKLPQYTPEMDAQIMRVVTGAQYAMGVKPNVEAVVQEQRVQRAVG